MSSEKYKILLTFDVEDWFQVENFKECIPFSSWSSYELRVEKNTHRLLDLLDSVRLQPSASSYQSGCDSKPRATFFVLGWVAERLPHLVREIHSRGHEVASHGYYHNLCNMESHEALKSDLSDSKNLLENLIGAAVYGYRAPSFSINDKILRIIGNRGYLYDSSFNSFSMHERYGKLNLSENGREGIAFQLSDNFYEIPISNLNIRDIISYQLLALNHQPSAIRDFVLPWGGGAYFRLIPLAFFKWGIQAILKRSQAYLLYLHPWEIDPEQPKVNTASTFCRFRHYINLNKTYTKLSKLLQSFDECHFLTCRQYLEKMITNTAINENTSVK